MSALAQRAGVSKGLAYHYFADKQALRMALVDHHHQRIAALASDLPNAAPAARIASFARRLVADAETHPEPWRMLLRVLGDSRPEVPEAADLTPLFEQMGVDAPELEARFFQVSLLGIVVQAVLSPRPTPVSPLVERLISSLPGARP